VVTSLEDHETRQLVANAPQARCFATDAFYRKGTPFNKGLAMEEGFDYLGRSGWICVLDADIALPSEMPLPELDKNTLYSPHRRVMKDTQIALLGGIPCEEDWWLFPEGWEQKNGEFAGYYQLFHAEAEALREKPWYGVRWPTAGGCDSEFWWKFRDRGRLARLGGFEVLHLGPLGVNWGGVQK